MSPRRVRVDETSVLTSSMLPVEITALCWTPGALPFPPADTCVAACATGAEFARLPVLPSAGAEPSADWPDAADRGEEQPVSATMVRIEAATRPVAVFMRL